MGRLVVSEVVTLDNVFEDPGGFEGTPHGGWQVPLFGDDERAFKLQELQSAGALLLGRVTYESFAESWPGREDGGEFGELMNNLPKHVATLTLSEFHWFNAQALDVDTIPAVQKLKETYERDILVAGSGSLVSSLLEADMVDELRIMVYPLVIGRGKRLFEHVERKNLQFVSQRVFQNGTVLLTYSQAKGV